MWALTNTGVTAIHHCHLQSQEIQHISKTAPTLHSSVMHHVILSFVSILPLLQNFTTGPVLRFLWRNSEINISYSPSPCFPVIFRDLFLFFPLFQPEDLNLFSLPSQGSYADSPKAVWFNGFHWNFPKFKKFNAILKSNIINAIWSRGSFVCRKLCVLGRKGKEDYNGCCISTYQKCLWFLLQFPIFVVCPNHSIVILSSSTVQINISTVLF